MNSPKNVIIDILINAEDLTLTVGENEYYVETEKYSLSINYSLEEKDYPLYGDKYDFNIQSIILIDNFTNEEIEFEADDNIISVIMDNCNIENWSNDNDIDLDNYIEDNF